MIINTILGENGTEFGGGTYGTVAYTNAWHEGIDNARTRFTEFETRVKTYDSLGLIDWNYEDSAPNGHLNTTGINWGTDIQFFHAGSSYNFNSIRFRAPDGSVLYEINRGCANVANHVGPVPYIDEFTLHATSTPTLDNDEDPNSVTFSLNAYIDNPPVNNVVMNRTFYTVKSGTNTKTPLTVQPIASSSNSITQSFADNSIITYPTLSAGGAPIKNLSAGDKVCVDLTLHPPSGERTITGNISNPDADQTFTECDMVVDRPYLTVYGGDAVAGGSIDNGQGCSSVNPAPIITFLNGTLGSGSQLAAVATGAILKDSAHQGGFITGKLQSTPGDTLAFSNTPSFGSYDPPNCIKGYEFKTSGATPSGNITSWGTDTYYVHPPSGGAFELKVGGINKGNRVTLYVDGDLKIVPNGTNKTLNYKSPNTWSKPDEIPSLTVIVRGNIFINPEIRQLDGVFVAYAGGVNGSGSGGTIYTCSDTAGVAPRGYGLTDDIYTLCSFPLEVNGSLFAKHIKWVRTWKSLRNASAGEKPYPGTPNPKSSETIVSGPEIYLSKPNLPSVLSSGGGTQYDSVTTLPPLL